ncbi:hypothetical protein [Nonomuraea dietziae]|uniref:hypothetical protein n=1 Tax=Nonomuraea dietziae TaxID=65515 RepID=UPI0033F51CF6
MLLSDIALLPADADRATISAYLTASTAWTLTANSHNSHIYRHDGANGTFRVFIPADDDPAFAEDSRLMCAEAIDSINAVALGLPANVDREALARLVQIVDWTRTHGAGIPDSLTADLLTLATGQGSTR